MKFIFLNVSNHPCEDWPTNQTEEAIKLAKSHLFTYLQEYHTDIALSDAQDFVKMAKIEIEDYPFPKIDPLYLGDLFEIAEAHLFLINQKYQSDRVLCAMIMGEMSLTMAFVMMLQDQLPIYVSTAERIISQGDHHEITKIFYFQRFRPYPNIKNLTAYRYFRSNPLNLSNQDIEKLHQINLKLPYHDVSLAMSNLYIYRYQIVFKVETELHISEHIGNMIRGALGYALEKLTCPNGDCQSHQDGDELCLFRVIYDESLTQSHRNYTRPFVLHPPRFKESQVLAPGRFLCFEFSLLGIVQSKWIELLMALNNAFASDIGKYQNQGKGICHLYEFSLQYPNQQMLYHAFTDISIDVWLKNPPKINWLPCAKAYSLRPFKLTINFITPTRLKQDNCFVMVDELKLVEICRSIFRRLDGYFRQAFQSSPKFQYAYYEELCESLFFQKISGEDISLMHWSNRKERKLPRDGFIGKFQIEGDRLYELAPLLWLGQFLNIGKNAMEGYGHYTIDI